ncbi:hypothetical protein QVD17_36157 [Tagetes erecta]|uniref:Uncharacterized protein n=1 Tax=Tagetes erecta TaxID=13708 RepID=A0AAD8JTJ9_TARER|nr:hypothetical protein QVD17_36157 [Tagetes erecta]
MANNNENGSFVPTGWEIVSYDDEEVKKWRNRPDDDVISAEPISYYDPNGMVEIPLPKEKEDGTILDYEQLLKNLKGWTVEKRKRQENDGKGRVDKGAQSNIYLQISQTLKETLRNNGQETDNDASKIGSSSWWSEDGEGINATPKSTRFNAFESDRDAMDLSWRSYRPMPYQASYPPLHQEQSGSSKQVQHAVFADLMRPNEPSPGTMVHGASSSLVNVTMLDEVKMMVQAQVESQIQARVAQEVADQLSPYQEAYRKMAEKLESIRKERAGGGLSPSPSQ